MKILDCTLRDGGYYTNWDFNRSLVETYVDSFNHLPVEYLEIGYRSNELSGYLGEYFYCPVHVMKAIKKRSNKKLVIILNEKDVRAEHAQDLLAPCVELITMVRIAIDPKNLERAIKLAKEVKKMGFEVGFNVMYMSTWKEQPDFLSQLHKTEGVCDYFYMVDSFGGVYPSEVKDIFKIVKNQVDVPIGFHGHNNLEMALINTLTAIDCGVDIVDGTITGMGRGAGNLKTELLLTVLNSQGKVDFSYNELTKSVDIFSRLQEKYQWGTNLPYMFSGANSLPQKQVMEWVSKRYYSFNSIIRALNNQSAGLQDNTNLPELITPAQKQYSAALIIGGGPSAVEHFEAINLFLSANPSFLIIHASSKNALSFYNLKNDQYYCLVGNEGHRLENIFKEKDITGYCILPPFPRTMGTYIPNNLTSQSYQLKTIDFTNKFQDTCTSLAIQSAIENGVKEVFVVGYDGYQGNEISSREQELFLENEILFKLAKTKAGLKLKSLTPTKYEELEENSIYSKF